MDGGEFQMNLSYKPAGLSEKNLKEAIKIVRSQIKDLKLTLKYLKSEKCH
jgi:hypothetical protein